MLPELASLNPTLHDEIMLTVAEQLPLMSNQDATMAEYVRMLPFVNTLSGTRRAPHELHDPR